MRKSVIGLMSGTSMDGVDAALIETDGETHIEVKATASIIYPPEFKSRLQSMNGQTNPPSQLSKESTKYHINVIEKLLQQSHITAEQIDLIGYHGQTLVHRPEEKFTLQIGDPQYLANHFKMPVVFDFRQNDIENGGQGAPLAPLYHQTLMYKKNLDGLVMVNCGGIANISIITGKNHEDVHAGFDTGPGNVLIDRFVREHTQNKESFDEDGKYGLRGKINNDLINVLFEKTTRNHYYQKLPPKSLDSNDIQFIPEILEYAKNIEDGCKTLAAFTAYTIAKSLDLIKTKIPKHWIIAGGGAKNPVILQSLKNYLSPRIDGLILQTADEAEFSSTYLEAELVAWLAVRSIKNLPLTIPQTTGVKKPVSGGKLFYPE